jgi:hypothetical protein
MFLALAEVIGFAGSIYSQERRFKSPGQRIYYNGIGLNGYPISFYGGPMLLRMHGGGVSHVTVFTEGEECP